MSDEKAAGWTRALAGKSGKEYWRSLADLLEAPSAGPSPEFPEGADRADGIDRRTLLKLLGASMALAGVTGCQRDPTDKIMPYNVTPPEVTPGIPRFYATSMTLDGYATGLLVRSNEGRPTKVEGNPDHPASLGATGVLEQASVLGLYDPMRARGMRARSGRATWDALLRRLGADRPDRGAGLRVLLEPTGSPLLADLVGRVHARFPEARFSFHSPARTLNAREGARAAFGAPLLPQYDFRQATVVLSLDADFLSSMPMSPRYARHFAETRRVSAPTDPMSRLYVVETAPSPTGTLADHRIRRRPSEIAEAAANIAAELILGLGARPPGLPPDLAAALAPFRARRDQGMIQALARDLKTYAGRAVVIVGEHQPPVVHALGHLIQSALGDTRATYLTAPVLIDGGAAGQDLAALVADLRGGRVDTLVVLGGNPAYSTPADLDLGRLIEAVPTSIYLGLYEDETAARATIFVPAAHYLEAWGDARAYDGTASIAQPLIAPLYDGRSPAEILAVLAGDRLPDVHRLLRELWARKKGWEVDCDDFTRFWQESLKRGVIGGSEEPKALATPKLAGVTPLLRGIGGPLPVGALEIAFRTSPAVHDGRFANNPWLQELPHPITKLTWDNAAWVSPATAARMGLGEGKVVELELAGRRVRAPILVVPGHADDAVTVELGYGRRGAEAIAAGVGFDANQIRPSGAPSFAPGLVIHTTGEPDRPLAITQRHWTVEGRPIALAATLAQFREEPTLTHELKGPVPSLLAEWSQGGDQWAMSIDMSICTGCSSCVVACQAENNIPVVGKDQVIRGREMHWLRIDTYYHGAPEAPSVVHQPMMCQHCEKAPCEYVCPVNATVHSPDGLNEMVYNRCVGTRFCQNNCPYKVRRFNWYDWYEERPVNTGLVKLQKNPDVTVRERGVMEKCTYCVQRIRGAEIRARIENRAIRPGEVVTACQQACPTGAIQFGSLAHQGTKVVEWREEPRSYGVLHDLGTQPRTRYLVRVDNPNPEME